MALLNIGEDPWLQEYESCEKLHSDIMEQLTNRQRYQRSSDKYMQISSTVRLRLKQYNNEVGQLKIKLNLTTNAGSITPAESERRMRQIELLQTKGIQMQKMFDEQVMHKAREDRELLLNSGEPNIWGQSSSTQRNLDEYTVDQIEADKRRMLGDQERGLENLSQIISRQKNIAHTISNEVDYHNEILDGLGGQMERTDVRVRTETQHISVVDHKDKTCVYWVIIILLFISIIVVAAL